jgi:Tfp pilus assembly protein PilO
MKNANEKVKKNLYYALPVICIIVVIVIGLNFIQPKLSETQTLQIHKQEELTKKAALEKKLSQLQLLDAQKSDLLAQLAAITVALPDQKEIPQLIIQLQKIAEESDVEIQGIQLTPGKLVEQDSALANKIGPEVTLNISYKGSYESIKTFLGKVYKAKRLINMDTLQVSASSNQGEDNVINATSNMITYYQPRPDAPKDATQELPEISTDDTKVFKNVNESYISYNGESLKTAESPRPQRDQNEATGSAQ